MATSDADSDDRKDRHPESGKNTAKDTRHAYDTYPVHGQLSAHERRRMAEARNALEEKHYRQNNKALILLAAVIIAVMVFSKLKHNGPVTYISSPISYEDATDGTHNYLDVLRLYANAGYTKLAKGSLHDLTDSDDSRNGIVSDVTIGGKRNFTALTKFDSTSEVIVYYHSWKDLND